MGQAFHYTHAGVQPLLASVAVGDAAAVHGLVAPVYDPEAIADVPPAPRGIAQSHARREPSSAIPSATTGVTPRTVIKAAKARLREIKTELRHHKALEKERAQLERMLAAANKPLASLTPINSRRAS